MVGIRDMSQRLRSTRSSLEYQGGGPFVEWPCDERPAKGGENALGGLIPPFLDPVKPFEGTQPERLDRR